MLCSFFYILFIHIFPLCLFLLQIFSFTFYIQIKLNSRHPTLNVFRLFNLLTRLETRTPIKALGESHSITTIETTDVTIKIQSSDDCFFDYKGLMHNDCVPEGQTLQREYYLLQEHSEYLS